MARHRDIDQAVVHLGAYASREEWSAHRHEYVRQLLGHVPDKHGLTLEQLFEEIDGLGHASSMVGFIDEATLVVAVGEERPSILEDYLKRRGWQETPRAREYLQGMRSNPPSLYEVQAVAPGASIDFRDRLHAGPVVRVTEHLASQMLHRWDCVIGRIVTARGECMLTGGTLSLTRATADVIEKALDGKSGGPTEANTPLLLQLWLDGLLAAARRPLPDLQNTDGETLLLSSTRMPVLSDEAGIERCLDALAGWTREAADARTWTQLSVAGEEPSTLLATARIEGGSLQVETNSRERLDRAVDVLRAALGSRVGPALASYEDPKAALRDGVRSKAGRAASTRPDVPEPSSAEIQTVMHQMKEAHYRKTLDDKVPMLGHRTPRQCARSKAGREKLVRWLKDIENGELRQAADQGLEPFDTAWMWRELGVTRE